MQNFPDLTRRLVIQKVLDFLLDGKRYPSITCGPPEDLTTSVIDLQLLNHYFYDVVVPHWFESRQRGYRRTRNTSIERQISTLDSFVSIAVVSPDNIISLHLILLEGYVDIHGFRTNPFP